MNNAARFIKNSGSTAMAFLFLLQILVPAKSFKAGSNSIRRTIDPIKFSNLAMRVRNSHRHK
jgi:hypothetical protein